ncbi:hypothetical protein GC173_00670 [bacterium]|nr:hypothetical protein [bacterium]
MAKFEWFVEMILAEHVAALGQMSLPSRSVPMELRKHLIASCLNDNAVRSIRSLDAKAIAALEQASALLSETGIPRIEEADCRFSYGKHGSSEMHKTFSRAGISPIFDLVKITTSQTDPLSGAVLEVPIDFKGRFDSMVNKRNLILHEDQNPSLSYNEVLSCYDILSDFASKISQLIEVWRADLCR